MEITVSMFKGKKKVQMTEGATGKKLIEELRFAPDEVILIVGGKPIPYTAMLEDGDEVKMIQVSSGG